MSTAATKAAHTPGPWRAAEWSCHAPTTIVASGRTILPNGTLVIAECGGQGRDTDATLLADARLIAAAPETFEALDNLIEQISKREEAGERFHLDIRSACAKGEAAIRKARE